MVNILITKTKWIDMVLDQMMGWTDGGAQTPFIPFSFSARKRFRKAELKSLFNLIIPLTDYPIYILQLWHFSLLKWFIFKITTDD